MREIKFRAYFIEQRIMMNWKYLINKIGLSESVFKETKNWKIMQYTGLKDKNGKEIYEGDIMQSKYQDRGEVKYDLNQTAVIIDCNWYNKKLGRIIDSFEVIGNIYENPELLKERNNK